MTKRVVAEVAGLLGATPIFEGVEQPAPLGPYSRAMPMALWWF